MQTRKSIVIPGCVPDNLLPWGNRRMRSGGAIWFDGQFLISLDFNNENAEYFASVLIDRNKNDMRESIIVLPTNKYLMMKIALNSTYSTREYVMWDSENCPSFYMEITQDTFDKMCALSWNDAMELSANSEVEKEGMCLDVEETRMKT